MGGAWSSLPPIYNNAHLLLLRFGLSLFNFQLVSLSTIGKSERRSLVGRSIPYRLLTQRFSDKSSIPKPTDLASHFRILSLPPLCFIIRPACGPFILICSLFTLVLRATPSRLRHHVSSWSGETEKSSNTIVQRDHRGPLKRLCSIESPPRITNGRLARLPRKIPLARLHHQAVPEQTARAWRHTPNARRVERPEHGCPYCRAQEQQVRSILTQRKGRLEQHV